jgi:hypothetical protein
MDLQDLIDDYMVDEYNPNKIESFIDAIQCATEEQSERFKELMEARDFENLGRFLWIDHHRCRQKSV